MNSRRLGGYEDIASEYYDATRHPTCANFREASAQIISKWLRAISEKQRLCEIGPGKSLVAEILSERGVGLGQLLLVDSSRSMLVHSRRWFCDGVSVLIGDAYSLPLTSSSIDILVSSLGDPYNQMEFWKEASRVLKPGGMMLFTLPSYEWASAFRADELANANVAEFELSNGARVWVPSIIPEDSSQMKIIESCGLATKSIEHVSISSLKESPLSKKLVIERGSDATILTGFCMEKV